METVNEMQLRKNSGDSGNKIKGAELRGSSKEGPSCLLLSGCDEAVEMPTLLIELHLEARRRPETSYLGFSLKDFFNFFFGGGGGANFWLCALVGPE